MARIRENKREGKVISDHFTVCPARDITGTQMRQSITWTPPEGLAPTKAGKAAERAADAWEQGSKGGIRKQQQAAAEGRAYMLPPDKPLRLALGE